MNNSRMNRRNFLKKSAMAAAASQLPLDALMSKTPAVAALPATPALPPLSKALENEIVEKLSRILGTSANNVDDHLSRARKATTALADIGTGKLSEAAEKELMMEAAMDSGILIDIFSPQELLEDFNKLRPYQAYFPEMIRKHYELNQYYRLKKILAPHGIEPPMQDPIRVLEKLNDGYYEEMGKRAVKMHEKAIAMAKERFGWDVKSEDEWYTKAKEIRESPAMKRQYLYSDLKRENAYTIIHASVAEDGQAHGTAFIAMDPSPEGKYKYYTLGSIRKYLTYVKERLEAGAVPGLLGAELVSDHRLLVKLDDTHPEEAKEALVFLESLKPLEHNLLPEHAFSLENTTHEGMLASPAPHLSDGYSK